MSWGRIDDQSAFHAKVLAAGNAAWGALCRMVAHANAHLTDGFIDSTTARLIASPTEIKKLLATPPGLKAPLLYQEEGGFRIHDFLEWNDSAETVRARRAAVSAVRSEAGKLGGKRSGEVRRAKQTGSKGEATCFEVASVLLEANGKQTGSKAPSKTKPSPLLSDPEEKKEPFGFQKSATEPHPSETRPATRKAHRLPADWTASPALIAWSHEQRIDGAKHVDEFRDYWHAKPGQAGTKLDWDAAFRTWVRNASKRGDSHQWSPPPQKRALAPVAAPDGPLVSLFDDPRYIAFMRDDWTPPRAGGDS